MLIKIVFLSEMGSVWEPRKVTWTIRLLSVDVSPDLVLLHTRSPSLGAMEDMEQLWFCGLGGGSGVSFFFKFLSLDSPRAPHNYPASF